jgi:hypothetical protein
MFADLDLTPHQKRAIARGYRPIGHFAEEYQRWRRLGWTNNEIAKEMGYRGGKRTVSRLANRARRLGLIPEPGREAVAR